MSFASRRLVPESLSALLGFRIWQVREGQTLTGRTGRMVRLHLAGEGPPGRPNTVIAKMYGPDGYVAGLPELRFYRELLPRTPGLPVPELLGFWDDAADQQCALLLEDLGVAHHPVSFPPPAAVLDRMADILAAFHAAWWDAPALQAPAFQVPDLDVTRMPQVLDAAGLAAHAQVARQATATFLKRPELTAGERALLERVAARWPRVFEERAQRGQLTLIHGDLHLMGNVLQATGGSELRVLDWATIKCGLGPHDLMFMLIPADAPDRLKRDRALIERYHAGLCAAGLSGYALEQCLDDYRLSLLTNLLQAVLQGSVRWFRRTAALAELWRGAELLED